MALHKGAHHGDFGRFGVAVARRTPRQHVGDIDRRLRLSRTSRQADGREHPVQKLPRSADKGAAFEVLIAARRLAQDQHMGLRVAIGKDRVARALFQIAKIKTRNDLAQFGQRCGARRRDASRFDGIHLRLDGGRGRGGAGGRSHRGHGGRGARRFGQIVPIDRGFADDLINANLDMPGQCRQTCVPIACNVVSDSHAQTLGRGAFSHNPACRLPMGFL